MSHIAKWLLLVNKIVLWCLCPRAACVQQSMAQNFNEGYCSHPAPDQPSFLSSMSKLVFSQLQPRLIPHSHFTHWAPILWQPSAVLPLSAHLKKKCLHSPGSVSINKKLFRPLFTTWTRLYNFLRVNPLCLRHLPLACPINLPNTIFPIPPSTLTPWATPIRQFSPFCIPVIAPLKISFYVSCSWSLLLCIISFCWSFSRTSA